VSYSNGLGGTLSGLETTDVDGDGDKDVVTGTSGGTVSVFINEDGALSLPVPYSVSGLAGRMTSADFDKDGDPDLAVACWNSGLAVMLNDGSGGFGAVTYYQLPDECIKDVQYADVDKDGNLDLVALSLCLGKVTIWHNTGSGGAFEAGDTLVTGSTPAGLCLADFEDDGDIDIATSDRSFEGVFSWRSCFDSDGDGFGDPGICCQTADNCPDAYNPDKVDSDNDGVGAAECVNKNETNLASV
jgi:hypothetical protein